LDVLNVKIRPTAALALAVSSMLLLAACSNGAGGMSGMDHSGPGMSSSSPAASSSVHNAQDVLFAQGMAIHHQQAIEMAEIVLAKKGVNDKVTTLARQIKKAQQPEIEQMNDWLQSWGGGEQTMSGSMPGTGSSSGMMTEDDMNALVKASGAKASSLFLTQMTKHHKGAIEMAQTEDSKGKNPDAVALADKIISDQTDQINQMLELSKQL
jgi:uncharacterized protein (DUF305 family)